MATGNIFRVTVLGTYLGQDAINVLHYVQLDPDTGSRAMSLYLANAFDEQVMNAWCALVSEQYTVQAFEVTNLDDYTDYTLFTAISNAAGTQTGQAVPGALCFTFRKQRPLPAFRNGYLRIAGVTEPAVNGNALASTFLTEVSALGAALGTDITDPAEPGTNFRHGYLATNRALTPPQVEFIVPSATAFLRLGTQSSRKPGYGT